MTYLTDGPTFWTPDLKNLHRQEVYFIQ